MRFDIAFTFTRSSREFIRNVAKLISSELSADLILFDEYHQEELSTPRGGLNLLEWYEKESLLIVVALSADYDQANNWTHFEWPQVLTLVRKHKASESVMLLRMDDVLPSEIKGLSDMAFAYDARYKNPEAVAKVILSRLSRLKDSKLLEATKSTLSQDLLNTPNIAAKTDLTPYLDWIIDQCQWVDFKLAGSHSQFPVEFWKMEDRYVELQAEVRQDNISYGRQSVVEALRSNKLIALLGEPGEGKTTALRYVALSYAKAAKNGESSIPIFLQARTLALHLDKNPGKNPAVDDFFDVWNDEVKRHDWQIPTTWLKPQLEKGAFVMIDELDGVSKESSSRVLLLIRDLTTRYPESRCCVVSRSFAWQHNLLPAFRVASMCDLADDAIREYIKSWGRNPAFMLPPDSDSLSFSLDLWLDLQKTPLLHDLARRPLFLMAICILYSRNRGLPSDRAELLKMITEWLIESRDPHSNKFTRDVRIHAYELLGFSMCYLPAASRGDIGELSKHLAKGSLEISDLNWKKVQQFLESEAEVTGLLRQEGGVWKFSHRTFQDYFAARHLTTLDNEWVDVVKRKIQDDEWEEVFALLAAILVSEGHRTVADKLVRVLLEVSGAASLAEKATAVERVFNVFRYVQSVNYSLDSVEEYRKMAADVIAIFDPTEAAKIPIKARYDAAVALGARGDLRLRGVTPTMVRVEGGAVRVGAQSSDPNAPNYDKKASFLEGPVVTVCSGAFEIGRYPVTVHEYQRFVDDGGYDARRGREYWSEEGWACKERENRTTPENWDNQLRKPNFPVTWISFFEAEAYCRWLTKQADDEWSYRLPTKDEWEFAVRRQDKEYRAYSWGDEPKNMSNIFGFDQLVPVGLFVEDRSQSGLCDSSCNVSEWTLDEAGSNRNQGLRLSRQYIASEREVRCRTIKGGNYRHSQQSNRTAVRSGKQQQLGYAYVGFRVVRRPKPIKIKETLPEREYPASLADYYQYYAHQIRNHASSRREVLNDLDAGLGDKMEDFLAQLFPPTFRNRKLLPCRLGDDHKKFEFNLLYQDSRIKIACEKQYGVGVSEAVLVQEIELRQRVAACILAFPQEGNSPLWEDLNDNDLDAIIFAVLNHFGPQREAALQRQGLTDNEIALAALPSRDELERWELEKVIKYQIFAGVRLLNTTERELARQFNKLGDFGSFMVKEFQDQLADEKLLLFLFDDNGELVWDLALIELLLGKYPQLTIVGVVSTEAVGNNATSATLDACLATQRFARLKDHRRFEIHHEKSPRSCIDPACGSAEFQGLWNNAGCIYIKGVAAFETLQSLPKPGFYAFVVYSRDSIRCTGYERDTGVLVAVPPHFECFKYGDSACTLKTQLASVKS